MEDIFSPSYTLDSKFCAYFPLQPIDKKSLLDSGIFCCLIHILNALLDPDVNIQRPSAAIDNKEPLESQTGYNGDVGQVRRLEVLFFLLFIYNCVSASISSITDNFSCMSSHACKYCSFVP